MTVHAPFRFAPINRWVYFPDWADLVTHDVPFKDGLSGEVTFEARAETPLLVGGPRRKGVRTKEGEVRPLQMPNGTYAIPGSSWQGMIRSILEIASFGKLGDRIEDRRFGYRSLGDDVTAKTAYRNRMVDTAPGRPPRRVIQKARPGWLIKSKEGPIVVRCNFARIQFSELTDLWKSNRGEGRNILGRRNDARTRYDWFLTPAGSSLDLKLHVDSKETPHIHANGQVEITYAEAHATAQPATAPTACTVVMTGNSGVGNKHMEFVFHSPDRRLAAAAVSAGIAIPDDVWRDFELIHAEKLGKAANPNWACWEEDFKAGRPVPVFYLIERGRLTTLGTAFMFKTAQPLSTHDMLRNSDPGHLCPEPDLPSLIFGSKADAAGGGLKRRVSFDLAVAELPPGGRCQLSARTVLLGPKPSYFPLYVRQPGANGTLPEGLPYATYDDHAAGRFQPADKLKSEHTSPELMGIKVWPAVQGGSCFPRLPPPPPAPPGEEPNKTVEVKLKALPTGTTFRNGIIRFHNLRQIELGALLWALTIGEEAKFVGHGARVHRIGMGKPFGLGAISIRPSSIALSHAEQPVDPAETMKTAMAAFVTHMKAAYRKSGDLGDWERSSQILTLFKAANPASNACGEFGYMKLGEGRDPDEGTYRGEQKYGRFLKPYVTGGEAPKSRKPADIKPPPANAKFAIGQSVKARNNPNRRGTIQGYPSADEPTKWLVKWNDQGGLPQPTNENKIDPA